MNVNSQVSVNNPTKSDDPNADHSKYEGRAGVVRRKLDNGRVAVELDADAERGGETIDFDPAELRVLLAG